MHDALALSCQAVVFYPVVLGPFQRTAGIQGRDPLEKYGETLAEINQQLLARALYAIAGMWPVTPPLKAGES